MPRIGREQSGTGIYHVMLRGINRQDLFEEPEDYWSFIKLLVALQDRLADDLVTRNQKPVSVIPIIHLMRRFTKIVYK